MKKKTFADYRPGDLISERYSGGVTLIVGINRIDDDTNAIIELTMLSTNIGLCKTRQFSSLEIQFETRNQIRSL